MLSRGFESIWNKIVAESVNDVRLDTTVTEIVRHDLWDTNDSITVHHTRWQVLNCGSQCRYICHL